MTMRVIAIEHPDTPCDREGDVMHYVGFIPDLGGLVKEGVEYEMLRNWGVLDNGYRFYLYEIDIEITDRPDVLHVIYPFSKTVFHDRIELIKELNPFLVKIFGGDWNSQAMAYDEGIYFALLNYNVETFKKVLHMEPTPKH